jgi:hypothetical protein
MRKLSYTGNIYETGKSSRKNSNASQDTGAETGNQKYQIIRAIYFMIIGLLSNILRIHNFLRFNSYAEKTFLFEIKHFKVMSFIIHMRI